MYETTKALILREVRYKESDRILTVLTAGEGKRTLKARGALRKGSKSAAATQQLTFSELTVFENRGRATVSEGVVLEAFEGLRADFSAFALGCYFAEVLEAVSEEGVADEADQIFSVQYHPESAPGPQDSAYLFGQFVAVMAGNRERERK